MQPVPLSELLPFDLKQEFNKDQAIRSSDWELVCSDPFRYFLTRRLNIVPTLSYSQALTRGSYFHLAYQHDDPSASEPSIGPAFDQTLADRLTELLRTCNTLGIHGPAQEAIIERETRDAESARAWYVASCGAPLSPRIPSWRSYFTQGHWKCLAKELSIALEVNGQSIMIQLDGLYYHQDHKTLWILDLKTCSELPIYRLQSCPIEFQTQLYLIVCHQVLSTLIFRYHLDPATKVAGMLHVAIQKPTILFGLKDRDSTLVEHAITRGPNKGTVRTNQEFTGEPKFSNYLTRTSHWYRADGPYSDLAPQRLTTPVVNISSTPLAEIDLFESAARIKTLFHYAAIRSTATLYAFPKSSRGMSSLSGKPSLYAPFYTTDPSLWPSILTSQRLCLKSRPGKDTADVSVLIPVLNLHSITRDQPPSNLDWCSTSPIGGFSEEELVLADPADPEATEATDLSQKDS